MDARYKVPMGYLCYAAICFVIGGLLAAVGAANDNFLTPVGGLLLLIGVVYVVTALAHIGRLLAEDD